MSTIVRQPVVSSFILSMGYDHIEQVLECEFANKKVFRYKGVPNDVFVHLMGSESKGRYFKQNIQNKYDTEEIRSEPSLV